MLFSSVILHKKKKIPTSYFMDGIYKSNGVDYEFHSSCFLQLPH